MKPTAAQKRAAGRLHGTGSKHGRRLSLEELDEQHGRHQGAGEQLELPPTNRDEFGF